MYNTNNNGNCVGLHQQSTTSNNNICHQMQSTNKDVRDIPISNNSPIQLITQQQRPPLNFVENVKKNKIFKFKSDLIIMYTFGTKKYYLKGYRLSN